MIRYHTFEFILNQKHLIHIIIRLQGVFFTIKCMLLTLFVLERTQSFELMNEYSTITSLKVKITTFNKLRYQAQLITMGRCLVRPQFHDSQFKVIRIIESSKKKSKYSKYRKPLIFFKGTSLFIFHWGRNLTIKEGGGWVD